MCVNNKSQEVISSLEIISKDRSGLVHEITGIISELNITIVHHEAKVYMDKEKGMVSDFKVNLKTDDHKQLETLIRRLHKIKGMISVHESF